MAKAQVKSKARFPEKRLGQINMKSFLCAAVTISARVNTIIIRASEQTLTSSKSKSFLCYYFSFDRSRLCKCPLLKLAPFILLRA